MTTTDLQLLIQIEAEKAIREKLFPGCVIGIVNRSGRRFVNAVGRQTYEPQAAQVTEQSIYDTASITKAIPTSTLALKALEEGRISFETTLKSIIPEFNNRYASEVTVRHLLTQTLDHGYALSSCKDLEPQKLLQVIYSHDFRSPPGTWFGFSNATSILLGMLVERVYGDSLDRIAEDMLFKPLNMKRTAFAPLCFPAHEIVPSEIDDWRGREVRGEIHDESAFVLRKIMVPGSAGLFSTVPDLLNFLEMLLGEGVYRGNRVVSEQTIQGMQVNQIESIEKWAAPGWELNQMRFMGLQCSARTIGKTGFTGCMVMCDFDKGKALAMLSNSTYPHRRASADNINEFRRATADIVFRE